MTDEAIVVAPLAGEELGTPEGSFVVAEWSDDGTTTSADFPIAPLHVHHADDEAWYVLAGTLGFRLGDDVVEVETGSAVFVPRGVPHTFWNATTDPARYLLVMPTAIARLVDELHAGPGDVHALFAKYDSELL